MFKPLYVIITCPNCVSEKKENVFKKCFTGINSTGYHVKATHEGSALVKSCFVRQAIIIRCVVFFDYDFLVL